MSAAEGKGALASLYMSPSYYLVSCGPEPVKLSQGRGGKGIGKRNLQWRVIN